MSDVYEIANGQVDQPKDIIIDDEGCGLILKDNASPAHYWRVTVSSLGILTTTDIGTTPP
jgi:hypothetical protein